MSYNINEFASTIRSQTGDRYSDLGDEQLANYWIALYPNSKRHLNPASVDTSGDLGNKDYSGDLWRPSEVTQIPGDIWHQVKAGAVGVPAGMMGIFSSFLDPFKVEKTWERNVFQAEAYLSNPNNTQYDDINNRPSDQRAGATWDYKAEQHRIKKERFEKQIPEWKEKIVEIQDVKATPEGERKQELYNAVAGTTVELQEWGKGHVDSWIANDEKLRGMLKWKEDNPYEFGLMLVHPSTWGRGFAELAPSMFSMYVPGGTAKIGGGILSNLSKFGNNKFSKALATGGKVGDKAGDVLNKYSLGTMMALEGGDQFNRTYTYLTEEIGMDPLQAVSTSGTTAAIYAPLSGLIERLQVRKAAKYLGIEDGVEKAFLTKMANRILKGVDAKGAQKTGTNIGAVLDVTLNSIEEGFIEGWQAGMGLIIDKAVEKGYGSDGDQAMYHLHQHIMSTFGDEGLDILIPPLSSNDEVNQGFYSAMLGSGVMGGGGSIASSATAKAFERWRNGQGDKKVSVVGSNVKVQRNGKTEVIIPAGSESEAKRTAQQIRRDQNDSSIGVELDMKTIDDYAIETIEQLEGGRNQFSALDRAEVSALFKSLPSEQSSILSYGPSDETNLGKRLSAILEATGDANYFKKLQLPIEKLNQINQEIKIYNSQNKKNSFLNKIKSQSKKKKAQLTQKFDETMINMSDDEILASIANKDDEYIESIIKGNIDKKIKLSQKKAQQRAELLSEDAITDDQIDSASIAAISDEFKLRLANKDTSVLKNKTLSVNDRISAVVIDVANSMDKAISRLKDPKQTNATILKEMADDIGVGNQFTIKDYKVNKAAVADAIVQSIAQVFNLSDSVQGETYQEESFVAETKAPVVKKAPRKKVSKKVAKKSEKLTKIEVDQDTKAAEFTPDDTQGLVKKVTKDGQGNTKVTFALIDDSNFYDSDGKVFGRSDFDSDKDYKAFLQNKKNVDALRAKGAAILQKIQKSQQKAPAKEPSVPPLEGAPPSDEWLAANAEGFGDEDAAIEAMLNEESEAEKKNEDADSLTDDIEDDLCLF